MYYTVSQFVNKRIQKYWKRNADFVITPPVENFEGKIINRRKNYFVSGAPFEPNKAGNVLLKYASIIGFNIKNI